ncbi:MAG TPA: DNA repair protein RadC [Dongiaceae bacterium]|jgi:DNA repair protein RadC
MSDDSNKDAQDKPHYLGHRHRLREKLLKNGPDSLADYELLELLLAQALPRIDVKPLAKTLIKEFGGFAGVIAADPTALGRIKGMGEGAIAGLKTVRAAALLMTKQELIDKPVIGNWQKLLDYCRISLAEEKIEQFHLLFLDHKNALIAHERQQTGTIDHAPVYPREVVKRALELEASAIIMVHNHPSGDPTPSKDDVAMTKAVAAAAEKLGILLHDHVVVGRKGHKSMRSLGLLG